MFAAFNWVDYTIIGIVSISILMGFGRGFIKEIMSLVSMAAGFVLATLFANKLAVLFTNSSAVHDTVSQASNAAGVNSDVAVSYIAVGACFMAIFLGVMILGAILSSILNLAFSAGGLGFGNRLMGAVFGAARGVMFTLVMIFVVQMTAYRDQEDWKNSSLVPKFEPTVEWMSTVVSPNLDTIKEKLSKTMEGVGTSVQGLKEQYQTEQK